MAGCTESRDLFMCVYLHTTHCGCTAWLCVLILRGRNEQRGEDGRRGRGGVAWTRKGGQGEVEVGKEKERMLGLRAPCRVAWVVHPLLATGVLPPYPGLGVVEAFALSPPPSPNGTTIR